MCALAAGNATTGRAGRRVAERDRAAGAGCGSGSGPRGTGPMGDGDHAGRVHGRAAAPENVGMNKHTRIGVAIAVFVGHVLALAYGGRVLLDAPVYAQTTVAPAPTTQAPAVTAPKAPPKPAAPAAPAPAPRLPPKAGETTSDPIRCWWKADRTAVRVGERFGLVLTCSVIETGPITVVPVLNQLEPGALSITPFEVVSGARGEDMVAPPWRYVQFDYSVRLLSDGFFGQDVMIPGVTVTYNLQTAGGTQGRDQTYMLPALPMRILSLVPKSASDIRDASGQTFASIASRRFRS